MSKIFVVGATGHIGGAVLDLIYPKYPDVHIKALVRDEKKGKILVGKYPRVTFVVGDLTSLDLLTREAKEADVVVNTGPDVKQDTAISAILEGLANHSPKAYYIHTAGRSLLWNSPGSSQAEPKIFDDVVDIQALKSFPPTTLHATSNALVFAASPSTNIAIISPTVVHGLSLSPLHPTPPLRNHNHPIRLHHLSTTTLQSHIHVLDLAQIYLFLLSSALTDPSPNPQKWGPEAFYFAASENLSFSAYMQFLISKVSKPPYNLLHNTLIAELPFSEAVKVVGTLTAYLFGIHMQVRCTRAKEVLGWVPRAKRLGEGLDEVLEVYNRERDSGVGMQELDTTYGL
ncbi:uncharacterized protein EAF01_001530 [Botrytis porri]|uniref:NmrA-like domain-containing protein n=1 Tax=Botrytis porri TaxID=87229 RepID=A0A4Z1KG58_9HELO|nr:uncharacterized protein EAF01_001530 [Botrytis porri]KAF7912509.1 hypothetical protein EAF01_001530 [Botrytis porri]TGO85113.1 hypothetical protein BPOR_0430g00070 [Botrytis porri]